VKKPRWCHIALCKEMNGKAKEKRTAIEDYI